MAVSLTPQDNPHLHHPLDTFELISCQLPIVQLFSIISCNVTVHQTPKRFNNQNPEELFGVAFKSIEVGSISAIHPRWYYSSTYSVKKTTFS